jgi:hypothetical protein
MDQDNEEARAPDLDEPEPEPEATLLPPASAHKSGKRDKKKALDSRPLTENAELGDEDGDDQGLDWLPEDETEQAFDESRMSRAFEQKATLAGPEEDEERLLEQRPLTEEELRQMRDDLEHRLREAQDTGGAEGAAKAGALWRRWAKLCRALCLSRSSTIRVLCLLQVMR